MSHQKKRILIVNEFSQLNTGFSTYMYYVLPYLVDTNKYEIAELATYAHEGHPKLDQSKIPWKVYPNDPHPQDHEARQSFGQNRENQFGKWKFEDVCLDFRPDIVVTITDPWMSSFIMNSPYRKYYKWLYMPTIDGFPQKDDWLEQYTNADMVMTYSAWAFANLKNITNEINLFDVASPGADTKVYAYVDDKEKIKIRDEFGVRSDLNIIMTVMRNQPRKLYPELMKSFNLFLKKCKEEGNDELARKSYLYFHTSHPDVGWDFAEELRSHNLNNKVLFTYMCDACKAIYPSFFRGERTICQHCKENAARLPNTAFGVSREALAKVMAIGNLYVQHSTSEGWGMPCMDAKALGIPVFATDSSAMMDHNRNGGGKPIPVERFFKEAINQTGQYRAYGNNQELANMMFEFFTSSDEDREKMSLEARACAEDYDWENVAKIWERAIDNLEVDDQTQTWYSQMKIFNPSQEIPFNQGSNEEFVFWGCHNILNEPDKFNTYFAQKCISYLNAGYEPVIIEDGKPSRVPFDRKRFVELLYNQQGYKNQLEQIRHSRIFGHLNPINKPEIEFTRI